jgi:hypothetical protein
MAGAVYNPSGGSVRYELVLEDDGNGNLVLDNGDGTAVGTINYSTGKVELNYNFANNINSAVSWFASYQQIVSGIFQQLALPYRFSIGRTDALPGSLLVKYYTEGVDSPWYAREVSGSLELQSDLQGWVAGVVFSDTTIGTQFRKPYFLNGQWVMASHAPEDYNTGAAIKLFITIQGQDWAALSHNIPIGSRITHFAAKESGPVYIGAGSAYATGDANIFISGNLASWTGQNVGSGRNVFLGIVYVPSLDMFIAIKDGEIYTSIDDGATWVQQVSQIASNMAVITVCDFGSGDVVMIFSRENNVQTSVDGVNWVLSQSNLISSAVDAASILVDGQQALYVVDAAGDVAMTLDGEVFEVLPTALNGTPTSLASDGVFNLVATIDNGTIDVSSDFGETWINQTLDHVLTGATSYHVAFSANRWLHLSYDNADAQPATLLYNVMTDTSGDPIKTVGAFNPSSGIGEITVGDLPVSAAARYVLTPRRLSSFVVFTWGAVPVHDNSFTVFGRTHTGAMLMLSEDSENPGTLTGDGTGTINKETGVAELTFSHDVRPETIRISYSYGSIYKPEYDEINTRALPLDGLVPVVQAGDVAVIVEHARAKLISAITDAEMAIDIDDGAVFPDRAITVKIEDEEIAGTMSGDTFSVTARGANGTTAAEHDANTVMRLVSRREEMINILQVAGNRITTPNPLAYDYKAGGAILTSAIVKGDLYARESGHHTQDGEVPGSLWIDSDDFEGTPADGTYNFADHPLELTNQGTTTERWKLTVTGTSPVTVNVEGEYLGIIATDQAITSDIAPSNPQTGGQYFILPSEGWGAGWQVGNILRFNTVMAGGPAWITRVINARASDIQDDYATIQSRGDVAV